jgi:hypothetical protein
MRLLLTVLLTSSACLTGATAGFADDRLALSGFQLDGVTPRAQYLANQYQLRVTVESLAPRDSDRTRDAILQDEFDASMARMEMMQGQQPVCTPARRALLALAETSEIADPTSTGTGGDIDLSAMTLRQSDRTTTVLESAPGMPVGRVAATLPTQVSVTDSIPAAAVAVPLVRSSSVSSKPQPISAPRQALAPAPTPAPRQTSTVAAIGGASSAIRNEQSVSSIPTSTVPSGARSALPADTARFTQAYPVSMTNVMAQMQSSIARVTGALQSRMLSGRR